MSDVFSKLSGYREFRWLPVKDKETDRYNEEDYADYLTLEEAKEVVESGKYMNPNTWRIDRPKHENIVEAMEAVKEEWDDVEVRFGGYTGDPILFETVWIGYEDIDNPEEFERWMELRFCHWVEEAEYISEDTEGVELSHEEFRSFEEDEYLWGDPEELHFREDKEWGKYCRLWWDD